jgi:hypothetical protein
VVDHQRGSETAGNKVSANSRLKHRLPSPEGLLPEGKFPGVFAVLKEVLIPAPDIVHENVNVALFTGDTLKQGVHLVIIAVIAAHRDSFSAEFRYVVSRLLNCPREVGLAFFNRRPVT